MWPKRFDPMDAAQESVAAARTAVGERLLAAALYGSAARGEFDSAHSDVNVIFVFTALGTSELEALRHANRTPHARLLRRPA